MASYGGELLLDSSSPWSVVSSLFPFLIPLPFIFQEAKESIDEEDPRPTSSNGADITLCRNILEAALHEAEYHVPECWEIDFDHGISGHVVFY